MRVIGLTGDSPQRLVRFKECNPENARDIGAVSGLNGLDTALVGIDFRVQDGLLYGVGNAGGLYTIDAQNAVATPVPAPVGPALDVALNGASFGVDFNPAANALRIVSDTGQNLRHPFAGATQGVTQTDTMLSTPPAAPSQLGVTAAAYTNNDLDAITGTTLFDLNTATDQTVLQSPANSGQLAATGSLTVAAGAAAGFDVYATVEGGRTVENEGFAVLDVAGNSGFYSVDLLTGSASLRGLFDASVVDLAIPLTQK